MKSTPREGRVKPAEANGLAPWAGIPGASEQQKSNTPVVPRGRILIVDDEEVIAATLREFLESEGFAVASAGDLPRAVAQVEGFEPEIVLCDVQLPGDGITVLNRTLELRPETLFIMITAYATVEIAVAALQRAITIT